MVRFAPVMWNTLLGLALAAAGATIPPATTTTSSETPQPIQDNSFLIEEAYNQEWGVIQHISSFIRNTGGDFVYAFTEEWPVPGQRHQLSATVPVVRVLDPGRRTGLGDVLVNYRYQLVGSGETRLDRKSTRLNSSHLGISYAVFCL